MQRLTVRSVNTAGKQLSSSAGVSSDPEQKDMCFQASDAKELLRTVQPPFFCRPHPDSLFPENTKGQTESRGMAAQ